MARVLVILDFLLLFSRQSLQLVLGLNILLINLFRIMLAISAVQSLNTTIAQIPWKL
jgi:hypothetical protein